MLLYYPRELRRGIKPRSFGYKPNMSSTTPAKHRGRGENRIRLTLFCRQSSKPFHGHGSAEAVKYSQKYRKMTFICNIYCRGGKSRMSDLNGSPCSQSMYATMLHHILGKDALRNYTASPYTISGSLTCSPSDTFT